MTDHVSRQEQYLQRLLLILATAQSLFFLVMQPDTHSNQCPFDIGSNFKVFLYGTSMKGLLS